MNYSSHYALAPYVLTDDERFDGGHTGLGWLFLTSLCRLSRREMPPGPPERSEMNLDETHLRS